MSEIMFRDFQGLFGPNSIFLAAHHVTYVVKFASKLSSVKAKVTEN